MTNRAARTQSLNRRVPSKSVPDTWQPENIPAELTNIDRWVGYRLQANGNRLRKIPISLDVGKAINAHDPSNWHSFDSVFEAWSDGFVDGFGVVLTGEDPYVCIDIDKAVRENGIWPQIVSDAVTELNSYTEISASGQGLHIFVRGNSRGIRQVNLEHIKVDIFDTKQFIAMTGTRSDIVGTSDQIQDRQTELDRFVSRSNQTTPIPVREFGEDAEYHLEFDGVASGRPETHDLIALSHSLKQIWGRTSPLPGQIDTSPSAYCFLLAGQLAYRGVQPQEIMNTLVEYRRLNRDSQKNRRWFEMETNKAIARSQKLVTASTKAVQPDPWNLRRVMAWDAARSHYASMNGAKPIDLLILGSLIERSVDGIHSTESLETIAARLGLSKRYVSERIAWMEVRGCLATTTPRPPKTYRLNIYESCNHNQTP
jgi:hypothetical protein